MQEGPVGMLCYARNGDLVQNQKKNGGDEIAGVYDM